MKDTAKYVIERIIFLLLTLFIILSVTYILLQCLPPNINTSSFTEEYRYWENQVTLGFYYRVTDPGQIAAGKWEEWAEINGTRYYYAPYPVLYRYWVWLCNVFGEWNWGTSTSVALNQDVISIIAMRLPASMKLNIVSIIVSIPLGLGLGIWAALKKNTWIDTTISTIIMIFISANLLDYVLGMFNHRKMVLIISGRGEEMAEVIMASEPFGITLLRGKGAYSGQNREILLTVTNNMALKRLETIVFGVDPHALFIVENTFYVAGGQFRRG